MAKAKEKKSVKTKEKEEVEFKPRIRIKVKAYDHRIIDEAVKTIIDTAKRSGATIVGPVPLPTEKKKQTVLRSSFVHKDSREQYEVRIHKRLIEILNPPPKTVEALTTLSLPAGIDIEIKM